MSSFIHAMLHAFPVPNYLTMPGAALDISPNSIKLLTARVSQHGCFPVAFDEVFLPQGAIVDGAVHNPDAVVDALIELCERHGLSFVHVSIPEDALYLYTQEISGHMSNAAIAQQVEFTFSEHVPFAVDDAVYDHDVVSTHRNGGLVSVTAVPRSTIAIYEDMLQQAGLSVLTLELEAQAIARSVSDRITIEMLVDVGHARTGIIVTQNGIPIFTATVDGGRDSLEEVAAGCMQHHAFWDTRTNDKGERIKRVHRIVLCGGGASQELHDMLSERLETPVVFAEVWQHLFSTDEYIPEVFAEKSLSLATLAGLLLNNKKRYGEFIA